MVEKLLMGVAAFGVVAGATPLLRRVALRKNWTPQIDPNKWPRKANPHPVAMGGGLVLFVGILVGGASRQTALPLCWASMALLMGLYDDLRYIPPQLRLVIQTLLAMAVVGTMGHVQGLPPWLAVPVTIFGIVGLINAVNMMDNMDGLAGGLMALTMAGYAWLGVLTGNDAIVGLSLAIVGACLGFWFYNKPPARIFMGDTGSVALGLLLGIVSVWATYGEYPHGIGRIFAPFLLVALFIADTTFVVLWRWAHRLPIMRGDRNHLSHRLATWLGSEWGANGVLYAIQAGLVLLALGATFLPPPMAVACLALGILGLGWLGWRLWGIVPKP